MRRIRTSAVLAAALLGMCVGSARAQETVEAKVPFAFVVRGQEFPAGRYDIISNDEGMIMIRGIDNGGGGVAMTSPAGGNDPIVDQPSLVFIRHDNKYRLSQIWESSSEGLAVQEPRVAPRGASAASGAPIDVAAGK
jgi:hypothetical protein